MIENNPEAALYYLVKTVDQQDLKLNSIQEDLLAVKIKLALIESEGRIVEPKDHQKITRRAGAAGGGIAASIFTLLFAALKYFGIQV